MSTSAPPACRQNGPHNLIRALGEGVEVDRPAVVQPGEGRVARPRGSKFAHQLPLLVGELHPAVLPFSHAFSGNPMWFRHSCPCRQGQNGFPIIPLGNDGVVGIRAGRGLKTSLNLPRISQYFFNGLILCVNILAPMACVAVLANSP